MNTPPIAAPLPALYRLSIERFRGIGSLIWHPARGMNVILGGGDVGKTTILDAIGLLLSPTNIGASDTDYYARNIELGFVIEAIVSLPGEFAAPRSSCKTSGADGKPAKN